MAARARLKNEVYDDMLNSGYIGKADIPQKYPAHTRRLCNFGVRYLHLLYMYLFARPKINMVFSKRFGGYVWPSLSVNSIWKSFLKYE